jgi:hypothetical protein
LEEVDYDQKTKKQQFILEWQDLIRGILPCIGLKPFLRDKLTQVIADENSIG